MPDGQPDPNQQTPPDGGKAGAGTPPDGGGQDTPTLEQALAHNKRLTADIVKEREARKAAEAALRDKATADQLAAAKTAEEVEAVKRQAAVEIAQARRMADLQTAAAAKGIHQAFLNEADDGKLSIEEVIAAADKAQQAFVTGNSQTMKLGGGNSPDGGGGGRIWKASEVRELAKNPPEFRKHEAEILEAKRAGRYRTDL